MVIDPWVSYYGGSSSELWPYITADAAGNVLMTTATYSADFPTTAGTFQPVKAENIADHIMHFERFEVPAVTLQAIADCKAHGGRVVAVGTTTVRALESYAKFGAACNDTNIFITPGFDFQVVDTLLTNFHLPKSTLMMLVSAVAGYEHIMALYQHAIAQRYRFFSYGDCMLLDLSE